MLRNITLIKDCGSLHLSHIKLSVVSWRRKPPNSLESVSQDSRTLLAKVWLWYLFLLLVQRTENRLTGAETQTDLPLDTAEICLPGITSPFTHNPKSLSPHLDKCIHLAIGGSGTNPKLQLHKSVEETSAPPALFFFFQVTSGVWLLTELCSEINRAKFWGDWTKPAINLPYSSVYLKHLKRVVHFQMHALTSVCGQDTRRCSVVHVSV